ncbi:uncharacterized protein ATC70_006869 [Mucor velutinosus]|uniref:Uncharacterized protein n=1 Tax=Mucor velutinosus TaxID=708070 RepID=A0AAN7HWB4_9FUNG|nr:hypothetical protein ATC70_006869 [Mucor velutinosus]
MTLSSDPNEADIIDIQDKLGYVDTGPIQQRQAKIARNQPPYMPATSSTSHIILKEPIPQRQVRFPMDYNNNIKKKSSTSARPETGQNSFYGATQPNHNSVKQSNSLDTTTTTAPDTNTNLDTIPYPLNVSQQALQLQQRPPPVSRSNSFNNNPNKGKERQHVTVHEMPSLAMPASSSSSSSTDPSPLKYPSNSGNIGLRGPPQTTHARDEIKDLFVSKFLELKELADMLQLIDEPLPPPMYNYKRSFEQLPGPTPSKSDPNYPQLRRKPSKGRMTGGYAYPSPENNRQMYNKSADSTTNYQEPNNRHTTGSRGIYNNTRDYQMDHHDNRTPHDGNGYYGHPPPPPQPAPYYHNLYDDNRDYHLANEEPFMMNHEDYYMGPPPPHPPPPQVHAQRMQPPPSRFYDGRQRRKSFSNLHEEQYRLNRKGSRGNMRRSTIRQAPSFYEYADMAPPLHQHHHPYPYRAPPYYPNQQYSPNGGGKGNGGAGDYYS